jgi:hypothetical protein
MKVTIRIFKRERRKDEEEEEEEEEWSKIE